MFAPSQPSPNLQPVVTYLKVDLPPNYRTLSYEGLQLRLWLDLGVKFQGATAVPRPRQGQSTQPQLAGPFLTGNVKVLVRKQQDNGSFVWTEIADEVVMRLQAGAPYQSPAMPLPWMDYRAVSNNALFLRVCYVPNAAQERLTGYTVQLQAVKCSDEKP